MKEVLTCSKTVEAIGPYSVAIKVDKTIYVSGQLPIDKNTNAMPKTIEEQAKQSLLNIKAILEENGSSMDLIIKTTVFVTDIKSFASVNEVYGSFFKDSFPARSLIEVSNLPKAAQIEIECIASCN